MRWEHEPSTFHQPPYDHDFSGQCRISSDIMEILPPEEIAEILERLRNFVKQSGEKVDKVQVFRDLQKEPQELHCKVVCNDFRDYWTMRFWGSPMR